MLKYYSKFINTGILVIIIILQGLAILYFLGYLNVLSYDNSRVLLQIIITITGIVLAIVFSLNFQKYSENRRLFSNHFYDLHEKQKTINLFRELCNASLNSHDIWQYFIKGENSFEKNMSKFKSSDKSTYVIYIYEAISFLAKGAYSGYSKSDEAQNPYTIEETKVIQNKINDIWYNLEDSGKLNGVISYLESEYGKLELIYDEEWIRILANKIYISEYNSKYTSLDYWREVSEYLYELCEGMIKLHTKLNFLSPQNSLNNFRFFPTLLIAGIVIPLILLAFDYQLPYNLFSIITILDISIIIYALIRISRTISKLFGDDLYAKLFNS